MKNKEIDLRLRAVAAAINQVADQRYERKPGEYNENFHPSAAVELEIMNMNLLAISAMLGEIAKRLPELE